MKKGLICFDLDDTLIKSNRCHLRAYQLAFKKNKIKRKISNERILQHFGEGSKKIVQHLFPQAQPALIEQIVKDHDYFVCAKTKKDIVLIPGAKEVLQELHRQQYLALISNCNHQIILTLLEAAKIPVKWFSLIVGQDQVRHPKPAPDELLKTEHLLKRKADYFIGDSIYDVRAGRRAGVKVIAIPSGVHNKQELQREKPFKICKTIKEIVKNIQ